MSVALCDRRRPLDFRYAPVNDRRDAIDVNGGTVHPVRLKFPRLVRVNRGSMSDSCTSSGHRSALTAIDWLQRWSAQFTSSPRAPLSRISAKVTLCGLARVAMVDVKTGAALKGIRVVAPIPRIGLYGSSGDSGVACGSSG
jgi:hypothetical protein